MPIHGILVERNQHVMLIAHAAHRPVTGANGEESMAAPNNGLIRVVGVEVETAPREDTRQNIPGAGDSLPVFATNPHCKVDRSHDKPFCCQNELC